jgi:cellulose synthase/poly-beta-1,6-N-acetylglucosamine synthase-like glycosyltransferase
LHRCLAALASAIYPRIDVLVVDNAPSDSRAADVARQWRVRYLVEPMPGLSRARNAGVRACSSEIVAFTDDDAVPEPDWISRLVEEFRDASVGAVTGRIRSLCGHVSVADVGPRRIRLDRRHPLWFEIASFGGIGNGGNMAFRRRALREGKGFDERLGRGAPLSSCEEYPAFAEVLERGYTITYTPDAIVRHPIPERLQLRREHHLRSRADLAGYATFLLLATRHKWRVVKYLFATTCAKRRAWRMLRAELRVRRRQTLAACVTGFWRGLHAGLAALPDAPMTCKKYSSRRASLLR